MMRYYIFKTILTTNDVHMIIYMRDDLSNKRECEKVINDHVIGYLLETYKSKKFQATQSGISLCEWLNKHEVAEPHLDFMIECTDGKFRVDRTM
jgi:hypothetical protein